MMVHNVVNRNVVLKFEVTVIYEILTLIISIPPSRGIFCNDINTTYTCRTLYEISCEYHKDTVAVECISYAETLII